MPEETDVLEVREASEAELVELGFEAHPSGYETWTAVLLEDGQIRGHIRLSRALGTTFGHDTRSWAEDARGALRLWRAAREKCRAWGVSEVYLHFEPGEDPRLIEFWKGRGFEHAMDIYKGAI